MVNVTAYCYEVQAWIDSDGRVIRCGHVNPTVCYSCDHAGESHAPCKGCSEQRTGHEHGESIDKMRQASNRTLDDSRGVADPRWRAQSLSWRDMLRMV